MQELVRFPAVAGTFYPASRAELDELVTTLLSGARANPGGPRPKAVIAPHAGYVYSGPTAAAAFAPLLAGGDAIRRVVIIGPAHRVPIDGLASPGVSRMRTPLGDVEVDLEALQSLPEIVPHSAAHAREHSLEVELPFVQKVAPNAKVVPLAVGRASAEEVARVLDVLWGGIETALVISSDLSHYLPYESARVADRRTVERVLALDARPLSGEDACGASAINGLVFAARRRRMRVELVDARNSGDTAGSRNEVVGYGAFAFHEAT